MTGDALAYPQEGGEPPLSPDRISGLSDRSGQVLERDQGKGMFRSEYAFEYRPQLGELITGRGRVAVGSGPPGEIDAGDQRARVLRAECPLTEEEQRRELLSRAGDISAQPRVLGKLMVSVEGVRVSCAQNSLANGQQPGVGVPGACGIAAVRDPGGIVVADGQRARVLGSENLFHDG